MSVHRERQDIGENIAVAIAMLDIFASVGVTSYDVTFTDLAGEKTGYQGNRTGDELRRTMRVRLESARRSQTNFIIRPRSTTAKLIQLDDLDKAKADCVESYSFMILCTSPGNFQAWVAVKDAASDFARRLRKGVGADATASGSTRVSGSQNFKSKYAPTFPVVTIARAIAGNVVAAAALEQAGLVCQPPPVFLRDLPCRAAGDGGRVTCAASKVRRPCIKATGRISAARISHGA